MTARDLGRTLVCLAAISSIAAPASAEPTTITHLAGRLEWSDRIAASWPLCGAWMFPVGDSLDLSRPYRGRPGYQVSRGVIDSAFERHTGADILNGRAGGTVRAAANGIVTFIDPVGSRGYGMHVVLGHRFEDGSLVYSVYAHLAPGTIRVRPGQIVRAGERLGRVGRTGRATTNHLHFEVRRPDDPNRRWEDTSPVDPLAFIDERRISPTSDSWCAPYQTWATTGALLADGVDVDRPLDEATWHLMLSRCLGPDREPASWYSTLARDARPRSAASGADSRGGALTRASDSVPWQEMAQDLSSLREVGTALAPCGVSARRHAERCRDRFGFVAPASATKRLSSRTGTPTVGDACVLLADLIVPPPDPNTIRAGRGASGPVANTDPAVRDTARAGGAVANAKAAAPDKVHAGDPVAKRTPAAKRAAATRNAARAQGAVAERTTTARDTVRARGAVAKTTAARDTVRPEGTVAKRATTSRGKGAAVKRAPAARDTVQARGAVAKRAAAQDTVQARWSVAKRAPARDTVRAQGTVAKRASTTRDTVRAQGTVAKRAAAHATVRARAPAAKHAATVRDTLLARSPVTKRGTVARDTSRARLAEAVAGQRP